MYQSVTFSCRNTFLLQKQNRIYKPVVVTGNLIYCSKTHGLQQYFILPLMIRHDSSDFLHLHMCTIR
jgi:hypothetical protein